MDARQVTGLIRNASTADELLDVLEQEMFAPSFRQIHIADAFSQLVHVRGTIDDRARDNKALAGLVSALVGSIQAGGLGAHVGTTAFWAVVELRGEVPTLLEVLPILVVFLEAQALQLRAQQAAMVLRASADHGLQGFGAGRLLELLAERVLDIADELSPREVGDVAWVAAEFKAQHPALLQTVPILGEVAAAKVGSMTAQELASFCGAAAALVDEAPVSEESLVALTQAAQARAAELGAQEAADLAQSVARLQARGAASTPALTGTTQDVAPASPTG